MSEDMNLGAYVPVHILTFYTTPCIGTKWSHWMEWDLYLTHERLAIGFDAGILIDDSVTTTALLSGPVLDWISILC